VGGAFLVGLVGGAIGGAIGGASEVVFPALGAVPRLLLLPVRPLALLLAPLLDAATRRPHGIQRSVARRWFYDGVTAALALIVIGVVLVVISSAPGSLLPFSVIVLLDSLVAGLLIAVPLLYFYGAVVTAFSAAGGAPLAPPPMTAMAPSGPVYAGPLSQPSYGPPVSLPPTRPGYYDQSAMPPAGASGYAGPVSMPTGNLWQYSTGAPVAPAGLDSSAGMPSAPPVPSDGDAGTSSLEGGKSLTPDNTDSEPTQ
jgi:hypothetical protein